MTQLASALQAVCTDFHGNQFLRVSFCGCIYPYTVYVKIWLQLASMLQVVCTRLAQQPAAGDIPIGSRMVVLRCAAMAFRGDVRYGSCDSTPPGETRTTRGRTTNYPWDHWNHSWSPVLQGHHALGGGTALGPVVGAADLTTSDVTITWT